MFLCFLLFLLMAQAYGQVVVDQNLLLTQLQQQEEGTCSPGCGAGECCVRVPIAMASRKRAEVVPQDFVDRPGVMGGTLYRHYCQPIKQAGQTCLLRNTQNEWCDCAPSLTCAHKEDVALNNFFGVCE